MKFAIWKYCFVLILIQSYTYLAIITPIQLLAIWMAHSWEKKMPFQLILCMYSIYSTPWDTSLVLYPIQNQQSKGNFPPKKKENIISRMYVHVVCDEWFRYIPRVAVKCQADEAYLNKYDEYQFSLRLFKWCHTQNSLGRLIFLINKRRILLYYVSLHQQRNLFTGSLLFKIFSYNIISGINPLIHIGD